VKPPTINEAYIAALGKERNELNAKVGPLVERLAIAERSVFELTKERDELLARIERDKQTESELIEERDDLHAKLERAEEKAKVLMDEQNAAWNRIAELIRLLKKCCDRWKWFVQLPCAPIAGTSSMDSAVMESEQALAKTEPAINPAPVDSKLVDRLRDALSTCHDKLQEIEVFWCWPPGITPIDLKPIVKLLAETKDTR